MILHGAHLYIRAACGKKPTARAVPFTRLTTNARHFLTLDHSEIPEQKRQLRQIFLQRRLEVSPEAYHDASLQIESSYTQIANKAPGKCIAGYLPMRGEMDITLLLKHFSLNGYNCALPVVKARGQALSFRAWAPGDALTTGEFGIKIPIEAAAEIVPDVMLIPLLAYDTLGFRLGYGGGYYDKTLRALRNQGHSLLAIGVAFSVQQIKTLPREKQDEKLDAILTEKGMVWF